MSTDINEDIRSLVTDRQWETYSAYCRLGSHNAAAKELGSDAGTISKIVRTVQEKALRAGFAPVDFRVNKVTTQRDGAGNIKATSVQVRGATDTDKLVHIPDPKKIIKTSTLFAGDRSVTQQWVLEKPEDVERERLWEAFAEQLANRVPLAELIETPLCTLDEDLLTAYPVGDHHTGMKSWAQETGANYDLKIAKEVACAAIDRLLASAPASSHCLIPFLGDFFHYDSYASVTPTSGHIVDADSRFPKMAQTGLEIIEYIIERAAQKHQFVHVIFEKGNHDTSTAAIISLFLARLYRDNPRITVDTSPAFYHYYEFGRCLFGTHHGHLAKPAQLPGIMACDRAEAWGRTEYRLWFTGHVHHEWRKEYPGCTVESLRVLAAADAYAANNGYRSQRAMQAVVCHRQFGEMERHTVNPRMLESV